MKEQKPESVAFRTTKELKAKLIEIADKEKRTLSDYLNLILEKFTKNK